MNWNAKGDLLILALLQLTLSQSHFTLKLETEYLPAALKL